MADRRQGACAAARRSPVDRLSSHSVNSLNDSETLARFVHNLREGVYITDAAGRILDANPAFLEMFGAASLDALQAYTAESLLADPQRRDEELAILARDGAVREFELEIRRTDGTTRTVLDTAYQVVDEATGERVFHGILVDITDRKNLERQLREMATRDPLTGCHNRRYLQDAIPRLESGEAPVGVIVVDVDHFKQFNDRHGHDVGDRILVQTARFLAREVRAEEAAQQIAAVDANNDGERPDDPERPPPIGRRQRIESEHRTRNNRADAERDRKEADLDDLPEERRTNSGFVEQQRLFARARR